MVDGELARPKLPLVPGHEIVGLVEAMGPGVQTLRLGQRVGVPWLGHSCGDCRYCGEGRENLCDAPLFTGYTRDGGFATHVVAEADFCLSLPMSEGDPGRVAPLLCAGLIGFRALKAAGPQAQAQALGLYGFGAAAHLLVQVARHQRRNVFAFTRPGDVEGQAFARSLGAVWAGGSDQPPPQPLDAAIVFAPAGELVPKALQAVRKGGRVVCAGIHMSDIPGFPYSLLWEERELRSVANLTRHDGRDFLLLAADMQLDVQVTRYALERANDALDDVRAGRVRGAAVVIP